MQQSALRSVYTTSHVKPKHAAVVLPILDQLDPATVSATRSDADDDTLHTRSSNNWSTRANVNRVPQDDDEDDDEDMEAMGTAAGCVLQKKSAQYEIPRLAVRLVNGGAAVHSNQESIIDSSGAAQKYTVLGQKQKWRRSRSSQRAKGLTQTIVHVDDTLVSSAPGSGLDELGDEVDLENPRFSVRESFSSSHDSERSSNFESEQSMGRGSSFSTSAAAVGSDEKQRFVVTRQKKSKFAARIYLPGQNPLYLGRYKSEAAALTACESAFSVITTPRK